MPGQCVRHDCWMLQMLAQIPCSLDYGQTQHALFMTHQESARLTIHMEHHRWALLKHVCVCAAYTPKKKQIQTFTWLRNIKCDSCMLLDHVSQFSHEKVCVDSAVACGKQLTHSGHLSAGRCHHRHRRHPACPTHSSLHPCQAQLSAGHKTRGHSQSHAPRTKKT